ncbi:hypothetical protein GCM10020229_15450 [Kitasatospora albolonga]
MDELTAPHAAEPVPPLAGFTVASPPPAAPRSWPRCFQRRGAAVQRAAALRIVPLPDDTELLAATRALVAGPAGRRGGHHRDRLPGLDRGRRGLGPSATS